MNAENYKFSVIKIHAYVAEFTEFNINNKFARCHF